MKLTILFSFIFLTQFLFAQTFTEVPPQHPFVGVFDGSISFSDVDGDNDPDVLITGSSGFDETAKLYLNDGMGNFSEKTGTPFYGVERGSIAFFDVDGDNDPDVLITGRDGSSTRIAKLYTNDGMGNFSEKTGTPFDGVWLSSIAFSDVDGDMDQDVLITGSDNSFTRIAKLYLNDGMGNFSEKTGTPFDGVAASSIAFSDIDGDNDPDVLITGYDGSNGISKLYLNDGIGNFSEKTGTPFDGVDASSIAFSDVDGDNDPDVLITGSGISKLYLNDGIGNFSEKTGTPFDGVYSSSIAFSDVDGDGDPDVLLTGGSSSGPISKLYINDGAGNFTEAVGTPFDGVRSSSIAFSDVDGDNDPDVLITGLVNGSIGIAKLYLNDGIGNFTEKTGTPFVGVGVSSIAFSDVDGDNDEDVLITGSEGPSALISKLYLNDGMGNFSEKTGTPFDGVAASSIAFSDIDGDNDPDVLITGYDGSNGISKLYLNDGMGNFSEKTGTPFVGVLWGSIAFSDVDGDNDPDALITGGDGSTGIAKLYLNDGMGNYTEKTGTSFVGVTGSSIAFSDVDGDNDPDVLITGDKGNSGDSLIAKLYTNDGMGNFAEKIGTPFDGVFLSSIAFSDVDGDNDPDILITGEDVSFGIAKLYLNDGMGNFAEKAGTPFDGVRSSSIAFSDVDGDTDEDVLITGEDGSTKISKLYLNDGMGNFSEKTGTPFVGVDEGSIAFSDVDGDTDEDVLITGFNNGFFRIARLYSNDRIGTPIDEKELAQNSRILLYPNPNTNGEVFIGYLSDKNNILAISLMSIEGRICFQQYSPVRHGLNNITVSYPALPSGWYIIKLDDGIRNHYVKLVIE